MADTAETVKKTIDQAASTAKAQSEKAQAAGAQAFREGVDKSVAGLTELNAQNQQNLEAIVASAAAAQKGAEALSQQTLAYSRKSWEDGVAVVQSLSQARSVQDLIELQTSWVKSASEAYLSEMSRAAETLSASVKDSLQPINERVTASVERFQAAR